MAITPRTIFSSAAPATVAAISLLAFSAVGTVVYMSAQCDRTERAMAPNQTELGACEHVRRTLGGAQSDWSEADWLRYTSCFEKRNNSRMTVKAASQGLEHYPNSEPLYNIKGYHQIVLDEHEAAVETLQSGLDNVGETYSGVLHNNLAWASLWAPREMKVDRARSLYRKALDMEPKVCAYLHTGLWVEYAQARRSSGVDRYHAMKKFSELRKQYEPCLARLEGADWKTVTEVAGAGALYANLEAEGELATVGKSGDRILEDVAEILDSEFSGVSAEAVCRDAMPVASTHHTCVEQLKDEMDEQQQAAKRAGSAEKDDHGCPAFGK